MANEELGETINNLRAALEDHTFLTRSLPPEDGAIRSAKAIVQLAHDTMNRFALGALGLSGEVEDADLQNQAIANYSEALIGNR